MCDAAISDFNLINYNDDQIMTSLFYYFQKPEYIQQLTKDKDKDSAE